MKIFPVSRETEVASQFSVALDRAQPPSWIKAEED